jgi:hypothetical protein
VIATLARGRHSSTAQPKADATGPSPPRAVATLAVAILVSGVVAGRHEFYDLVVDKETEDQVRRKGGLLER